tara:strand:+ start:212 stop:1090 length:879 start_codon:yes stop_codon:yes gene_type:complete
MSKLQVDTIVDKEDVSAPTLSKGAIVTGVTTSTSFAGALTGDVTGNITGNQSGGSINATTGDFSSAVTASTSVVVGSAVTSNADGIVAAGIVTAGTCFKTGDGVFGAGIGATITGAGDAVFAGICTAPTFVGALTGNVTGTADLASGLTGTPNITVGFSTVTGFDSNALLREKCNVTAGKLSDNLTINLDNGMVHLFTTAESTTAVPNIMSTVGINTQMGTGDTIAVTLVTTANASAYCTGIQVDGIAVTENWIGGSAPSDGGSSGVDIHSFNIIKTASETFTVIGNQSKTS